MRLSLRDQALESETRGQANQPAATKMNAIARKIRIALEPCENAALGECEVFQGRRVSWIRHQFHLCTRSP